LERFVAENDDLLAVEEQIGRFNIFDALGIARIEIRHSNCLAWLLSPGESHGQGDLFLKSLLMDVLRKSRQEGITPPISPVELDKLCKQIYANHRRALDLIWERVGSPASGLLGSIEKWISEQPNVWLHLNTKGKEVEFIPATWSKMLPPIGKLKIFEPEQWIK